MKNLLTFGCSFTDIDDEHLLSQRGGIFKYREPPKSWPVELARLTNSNPVCRGKGGVGNFYITNRIYDTLDDSDNSVVIVMWSGIDRVDIAVSKKEFYYFDKQNIRDNWLHSGGKTTLLFDSSKTKDRYWYNYYKTYHTEEDSYTQTLDRKIVQPIMPREIDLQEPRWIVITPDNWEDQLAMIEQQEGELVFLAMTIPDYEIMAYNMQEIKRYITELQDVVVYYRKVTVDKPVE